nr:antibiotic biosynthesis monooxygenase [Labrys sp. WJW]
MSLAGPGHGTRRAEPLRFPMLKVIARDFIKPEHVAAVLPLYRELVARTRLEEHCIAYDLFIDQKDPAISSSSRRGPIVQPSTPFAAPNISSGWCRRSMHICASRIPIF